MLRVVFTGPPSSGKSTTAAAIAAKMPGWKVHEEIATKLIKLGARGSDEAEFSRRILEEMLAIEVANRYWPVTIYDRGVPDSFVYLKLGGGIVRDKESKTFLTHRYDLVFSFASLPFKSDSTRNDFDRANAEFLAEALPETYRQLNYPVLSVPVCPVEERADLIINQIINQLYLSRRSYADSAASS
jgi:predicted ATPase